MKKEDSRKRFILCIIIIGLIILMANFILTNLLKDKNKVSKVRTNQKIETSSIKFEEFPLGKDVKELYDSKTVVVNSSKEDKIKNINIYKDFKEAVDKNKSAALRYIYPTKEGDTIIVDVYYDKDKGFDIIKDSRRDKFGQKEIKKYTYKYIYEIENFADKEKSFKHIVLFSNKENKDLALLDSTLATYNLFEFKSNN